MQKQEAIKRYLEDWGGDGHSIIKAESLVTMGFDREFVAQYAYNHKSGESFKEKIFDASGNIFESLYGVYVLDFSYAIAKDINADTSEARQMMGRGFVANCLYKAIKNALEKVEVSA